MKKVAVVVGVLVLVAAAAFVLSRGGEGDDPVGRVLDVLSDDAFAGQQLLGGGEPLSANTELRTDTAGRASFRVDEVIEDCQLQFGSRATVAPAPDTPVRVEDGSITCSTKAGQVADEFTVEAGELLVNFLDPIFGVTVSAEGTGSYVDYGFVELRRSRRGTGLLVGPGGEVVVGGSDPLPQRAETLDRSVLAPEQTQALDRMRRAVPEEPTGIPGGSRVLADVGSPRALVMGVDGGGSEMAHEFVRLLTDELGGRWRMDRSTVSLPTAQAPAMLAGNQIQAYASPEPVPGAAGLPLFDDENEVPWFLWVRPAEDYQDALRQTLSTMLDRGAYGQAYLSAFGHQPTYEAVRDMVYPSAPGESVWEEPDQELTQQAPVVRLSAVVSDAITEQCPFEVNLLGLITTAGPGPVAYEFVVEGLRQPIRGSIEFESRGTAQVEASVEVDDDSTFEWYLTVPAQELSSNRSTVRANCEVVIF